MKMCPAIAVIACDSGCSCGPACAGIVREKRARFLELRMKKERK